MRIPHLLVLSALLSTPLLGLAPLQDSQPANAGDMPESLTRDEIRWLERLPQEDRSAAERARGWRAPDFGPSARWVNGQGASLAALRGKVVLIQTFATRGPGRAAATRLNRAIKPLLDEPDFEAIAVHTPEDLDRMQTLLPKLKLEIPVLVDEKGEWCDQVGAFKRPVTYLIDRRGNVRYAGVSSRSIEEAARKLLDEPYNAEQAPRERPVKAQSTVSAEFPVSTSSIGSATDRRQQKAPDFYVEEVWKQPVGDASGKVVVLDFWATWCGPCVKAIPHMNDMQNFYGQDVICLGISDETRFDQDMVKRGLKANDFAYGLAVDTSGRLKNWFGVRGIPHVVVLSGDWVVRWQGHPSNLNQATLDPIVKANRALSAQMADDPNGPPPARWNAWLQQQKKR